MGEPAGVVGAVVVEGAEELAVGEVGLAALGPGQWVMVGLTPRCGDVAAVGGASQVADLLAGVARRSHVFGAEDLLEPFVSPTSLRDPER